MENYVNGAEFPALCSANSHASNKQHEVSVISASRGRSRTV